MLGNIDNYMEINGHHVPCYYREYYIDGKGGLGYNHNRMMGGMAFSDINNPSKITDEHVQKYDSEI